jgi:hypothetical protein
MISYFDILWYVSLKLFTNFHHTEFDCKLGAVSYTSCIYVIGILIVFLSRDTLKMAQWWLKHVDVNDTPLNKFTSLYFVGIWMIHNSLMHGYGTCEVHWLISWQYTRETRQWRKPQHSWDTKQQTKSSGLWNSFLIIIILSVNVHNNLRMKEKRHACTM